MLKSVNRKLLVSVYNPQEAREGILGGGRIIDSEDPKSALGNISPRRIMQISQAVLEYRRNQEVQLSTNIGEDQLIFRRSSTGRAIEKSPQEMAGKAAQAALGVAISMGTNVHPCSIVKVGLDGMTGDQLRDVLTEVVETLRRAPQLREVQVMSVLFAQDLDAWNERKLQPKVRAELVGLREFSPAPPNAAPAVRFQLSDFWEQLRGDDEDPKLPKKSTSESNLAALIAAGMLPEGVTDDFVVLNELLPHFGGDGRKTSIEDIRKMVDLSADAGADAMMLDTSILSKVSNVCLVDTSGERMAHFSPFLTKNDCVQKGILGLEALRFFVDYCHYRGIVPNIAGSVDSIQAQQLWSLLPELDQVSTRSAASATLPKPLGPGEVPAKESPADTRKERIIVRQLVAGLAPPEHGGVLNLTQELLKNPDFIKDPNQLLKLLELLREARRAANLPPLRVYSVDRAGKQVELDEQALLVPVKPETHAQN